MTNPRIIALQPQEDYTLLLHFENRNQSAKLVTKV